MRMTSAHSNWNRATLAFDGGSHSEAQEIFTTEGTEKNLGRGIYGGYSIPNRCNESAASHGNRYRLFDGGLGVPTGRFRATGTYESAGRRRKAGKRAPAEAGDSDNAECSAWRGGPEIVAWTALDANRGDHPEIRGAGSGIQV